MKNLIRDYVNAKISLKLQETIGANINQNIDGRNVLNACDFILFSISNTTTTEELDVMILDQIKKLM